MSTLQTIVESELFQLVIKVASGIAGLLALAVLGILILHVLHSLGKSTVLYRQKPPVEGWSRRFYPVCVLLIICLLVLMWLLNVWSHS